MIGWLTADFALDGEQLVDAAHRFDGERCLLQLRQFKELPAAVGPADRFADRARLAVRRLDTVIAGIGIGLQDAAVTGEMLFGMFAAAISARDPQRRRAANYF